MQRHQAALDDVEVDGAREPGGFLEARFRRAGVGGRARAALARGRMFDPRLDDNSAAAP